MSLVFCWQRSGIRLPPDELVALRACFFAGQDGLPARIRRHCRFDFHLPQPCTSLVKWRQGVAPVACRLRPLRTGQLHLHQLPRLGKGGRRDFGANSGRGTERRRRSGWRSGGFLGSSTAGSKGRTYEAQRCMYQELPARLRHGFPQREIIDGKQSALSQFNRKSL